LRDRKAITNRELDLNKLQKLQGEERLESILNQLQSAGRISGAIDLEAFRTILKRVRQRWTQVINYVPGIYPGRITLFLTTATRRQTSPALKLDRSGWGWRPLSTTDVQVCEVSGDHHSMFSEPNISSLAAELNASLSATSS
jgi:thioesterase domain-containing protein